MQADDVTQDLLNRAAQQAILQVRRQAMIETCPFEPKLIGQARRGTLRALICSLDDARDPNSVNNQNIAYTLDLIAKDPSLVWSAPNWPRGFFEAETGIDQLVFERLFELGLNVDTVYPKLTDIDSEGTLLQLLCALQIEPRETWFEPILGMPIRAGVNPNARSTQNPDTAIDLMIEMLKRCAHRARTSKSDAVMLSIRRSIDMLTDAPGIELNYFDTNRMPLIRRLAAIFGTEWLEHRDTLDETLRHLAACGASLDWPGHPVGELLVGFSLRDAALMALESNNPWFVETLIDLGLDPRASARGYDLRTEALRRMPQDQLTGLMTAIAQFEVNQSAFGDPAVPADPTSPQAPASPLSHTGSQQAITRKPTVF